MTACHAVSLLSLSLSLRDKRSTIKFLTPADNLTKKVYSRGRGIQRRCQRCHCPVANLLPTEKVWQLLYTGRCLGFRNRCFEVSVIRLASAAVPADITTHLLSDLPRESYHSLKSNMCMPARCLGTLVLIDPNVRKWCGQ